MSLGREINRLRNDGLTYGEIIDALGCSKSTVAYHVGEGQKQKTIDRTNRNRTLQKRELDRYKESVGCTDCGEKYPHYVLQFDHLPGFDKVDSPKQLFHSYNRSRAWEEVKKCEVVCANCHCIRTFVRGQSGYKNISEWSNRQDT